MGTHSVGTHSVRTPLARFVVIVVAVVVLALVSGGCQATDSTAVRIDGWELSRSEFDDQLASLAANETMVQLLQISPYGVQGDNVYSTRYTATILNLHVTNRLMIDEVERRGLEVDRVAAQSALVDQVSTALAQQQFQVNPSNMAAQAQQLLDDAGWLTDELVTSAAYSAALQMDLAKTRVTDEALRELYDETKDQLTEACARHILVAATDDDAADLAKAEDLRAQLDAGADFATLAEENSDDPGSASQGGDLGCAPKGTYVAEFDDSVWSGEIGVVGDPVKTSYGYHLIEVTSRGTPSFDEARPQLEQAATQQAAQDLQEWLTGAMAAADVWVDPRFGQWDPTSGFVIPPSGALVPTTSTTLGIELATP